MTDQKKVALKAMKNSEDDSLQLNELGIKIHLPSYKTMIGLPKRLISEKPSTIWFMEADDTVIIINQNNN